MKSENRNKKPYANVSILIYGAGGRQALPIIKGFSKLGCRVTVYCDSRFDTGFLSRYSNKKILYNKKNKGKQTHFPLLRIVARKFIVILL